MKQAIYLDHAAATPLDKRALAAMQPYLTTEFYNPSAIYLAAKKVSQAIDTARSAVAQELGARPGEIIFTSGGTEANNLALQGVAHAFPGSHIVTTALEHESVLKPVHYLAQHGWMMSEVTPMADGRVRSESVKDAITDKTVLVSVMYANNEVGTIQPIKNIALQIAEIRKQRRSDRNTLPLYLHTDAAQAGNYLDLSVHRLGVDLMTLNGGKLYGPKQSGVLYVHSQVQLDPVMFGGGQENGLRSGTENMAGIVGFAESLHEARRRRVSETKRLRILQNECIDLITKLLPKAIINGSLKYRLPNNVHITLPGQDNERLLFALDDAGIQAAAGSACSASNEEASHVLLAMGLSEADARASLRFSMGRSTTAADIRKTIKTLKKLV